MPRLTPFWRLAFSHRHRLHAARFWQMTPAQLFSEIYQSGHGALTRQSLKELCTEFPDKDQPEN